jgi:DNA-binding NarL/FixJ family response regulator
LEFVHPLIGEAIAEHMPVAERTAGHATAARELAADNADPEAVAAHLLVAEPCRDAWVVDRLVTAARAAAAKGAPRSVITYLTRALAEPPQPQHRAAVLAELGAAQVQAGMSDGFATLQQALQLTADPLRRARIGHTAAAALSALGDFRRTEPLLRQALHDAAGADRELALSIEAMLVALLRTRVDTAAEATQRLHRLRTAATADTAAGCLLLGTLAIEIAQVPGRGGEAAELATRAVAAAHRPDAAAGTLFPVIYVVIATGAHDRGQLACDAAIAAARRRHASPDLGSLLCARSLVGLARGAVAAAEADARASLDIATELEIAAPRRYILAGLLGAMVEQGRFEDADRELRDAALPLDLVFLVHAVGRLRAAQGRTADALAHFLDCGARLERRRWRHPGLVSWQADAALAAHRLDRTAEARRLADDAVHAAERYAAPTALGVALRAAGMIDARLDLLHAAVEALAPTPARLEHARALVELGAALRRANQRVSAREPLRLGGDTAHHCGAMSLARRAEDELRAAGARPRRRAVHGVDALTTCERRVADLAATGSSNREIAQALFVTVKTVELHLGAAYRKLGISSRAELPDALATDRR